MCVYLPHLAHPGHIRKKLKWNNKITHAEGMERTKHAAADEKVRKLSRRWIGNIGHTLRIPVD